VNYDKQIGECCILAQCRKEAPIHTCSLQNVEGRTGMVGHNDRLKNSCYLSTVDHDKKIRSRKQKIDVGKYSYVKMTIQFWNQLPADALGTLSCKPSKFRKKVKEVIHQVK
jgi:hypothetical protein